MVTDGVYYFNRCRRCNTLITKLQVLKAFGADGEVCACGSMMFGPTNPLWYEWFTPRAVKMIVYQLLGKLAPAPQDPPMSPGPTPVQNVPPLSPEEIRPPEEGE